MDLVLFSLFIVVCLVFSLIEIFEKKSFIILNIILVIFFVALIANRSYLGTADTSTYVEDFASVRTNYLYSPQTVDTIYQFEYGYTIVSQISKIMFGNNVNLFFGIIAFINLIIVTCSCKIIITKKNTESEPALIPLQINSNTFQHNKNILFAPLFSLYASYFGFMYSGIVLRQGLAFSLLLIAFYFLIERKYIWGLFFLFISFFFHNTAIFSVGILLFVFKEKMFRKKTYYRYLTVAFLLYIFKFFNLTSTIVSNFLLEKFGGGFTAITSDKISTYLSNNSGNLSQYSLSIIANFIFSFISIRLSDNTDKFQHKLLQINLFAISMLSLLAGILALTRAIDYYSIFNIILFYVVLFNKKVTLLNLAFFCVIVISNSIIFYRLAIL